ncbi:MAG: hypothetical protein R3B82_16730 [Sandaracinaceae bacterium]
MSLHIHAVGTCTALGPDQRTNQLEQAAGTTAFEQTDVEVAPDEPLRASRCALLEPTATRSQRIAFLAAAALDDLRRHLSPGEIPVVLALPELGGAPFSFDETRRALSSVSPPGVHLAIEGYATGRAGFALVLERARELLAEGRTHVIVGGADSLADDGSLRDLAIGPMASPPFEDGYLPGEGAALLLVSSRPTPSGARVLSVGMGLDPAPWFSEAPTTAEGLTEALHRVGDAMPDGARIDRVVSAHDGRERGGRELLFGYLRTVRWMPEPLELEQVVGAHGDTGAAAGVLGLVRALERGGLTLVCGASDDGLNGACLVAAPQPLVAERDPAAKEPTALGWDRRGPGLVEERARMHLEEIGTLIQLRSAELVAEHASLSFCDHLEARIHAHRDALLSWGPSALRVATEALTDEDPEPAMGAIYALLSVDVPEPVVELVLRALETSDTERRSELLDALALVPPRRAEPVLAEGLGQPALFDQLAMLVATQRRQGLSGLLLRALVEPSTQDASRRAAAMALAELELPEAAARVVALARQHPEDPDLRWAAFRLAPREALRFPSVTGVDLIPRALLADPESVQSIEVALREAPRRTNAVRALGWLGLPRHVPLLLDALSGPEAGAAAVALERMLGTDHTDEVPDPEQDDEDDEEDPVQATHLMATLFVASPIETPAPTTLSVRSTDPARYRASWELSRARLAPSVRIRRGRPIDAKALLDEMIADENGCEDRSLASLELWLHAALPVVDPRWSHERRERATCAVSDALGAREAK